MYLTDSVGKKIDTTYTPTQWLSVSMALAGLVIFAVTPIMGQRSDIRGTRRRALGVWSAATFALMALLFFVRNDAPVYFWFGLTVLAVASVTMQFAEVNYFAQLGQVSTPDNVGKVSGIGWSAGYFGGIVLLLLCYFGFVAGDGGALGLSTEGGWNIRLVALVAAAWFGLLAIPVLVRVPEIPPAPANAALADASRGAPAPDAPEPAGAAPSPADDRSVKAAYLRLFRDIRQLWQADRNAAYFLFASAIFRDGLSAVFAFGAVLGVSVYGLSSGDVLLFGVAANVVAALGAVFGGLADDRLGPKPIILACLFLLTGMAVVMYFAQGPVAFWICGLILCVCVGPAQSASRSFLARVAPPGREGQLFGLYATTGRAVSWLTPALFGMFVSLLGQGDRGGIIAIGLVLFVGALILLPVRDPRR